MSDYLPYLWVDDDGSGVTGTTVSAERMNQIEEGIADHEHNRLTNPNGDVRLAGGSIDASGGPIRNLVAGSASAHAVTFGQTIGVIDNQGELLAGTGADAIAAVASGAHGQVLTAASAGVATGMEWQPAEIPGVMKAYGGSTAPPGYLLCDGSAVSRTTYARLFAAVGISFGAGDGSTTFTLPDLRGRVPIGVDGAAGRIAANDALGNAAGAATHTLTEAEIPAHDHSQQGGTVTSYGTQYSTGGAATAASGWQYLTTENAGGGGAHNNLQPYQVVNWIIKT